MGITTPRVNKNEENYRYMTEKLVAYFKDKGLGYWELQDIWNWTYWKTKKAYEWLPENYK
jgi:hypothetical protein